MNTRVMCVIPTPTDATSLYRGIGPIARIAEKYEDITITTTDMYDWASLEMGCDVMFMQRPYTEKHLAIAKMAKRMRRPLVLDYDDDLLSVPQSNPTHSIYGSPEVKNRVAELITLADYVMCSTQFLADKLSKLKTKAKFVVINNALDFKRFGFTYVMRDEPTNNLVMWRGSKTHDADIMSHLDPIAKLVEKHKDYVFHFQGGLPWFAKRALGRFENVTTGEGVDIQDYFQMISTVRPCLWLVPLESTEFNKSKSNIAWLEAVTSGSVAVCPDWDEWQVPGALLYKNTQEFFDVADEYLSKKTDPRELNEHAWNTVIKKYDLERMNELRVKIFKETHSGKFS